MGHIYDEIEASWRDVYADMHREPSSRSGFDKMLLEIEAEVRAKTTDELQPHLGIFEFGLEWLAYVHVLLGKPDELGPIGEEARAPWALVGSAVSFGLSIRTLLLNGFDTPARALLRTYVETLFLCIVLLHDRGLAAAYAAAQGDEEVKNFWHTSASPKRLHERIIAIEKKIGFEKDIVHSMTEWRREEYKILSQSSHLSYIAAVLTAVSPKLREKEKYVPSMMGLASEYLPRTLFYAAATTWYFSRMSHTKILGYNLDEALVVVDKENEWHQRFVAGRDTLSTVMLNHWKDDTADASDASRPTNHRPKCD
jgi:hypothetical protein